MPKRITLALSLMLAAAAHAADDGMASIKAYSDRVAAIQCHTLGYPYLVRLLPNRPEVVCLASPVGIERDRVVDVRAALKEVATFK